MAIDKDLESDKWIAYNVSLTISNRYNIKGKLDNKSQEVQGTFHLLLHHERHILQGNPSEWHIVLWFIWSIQLSTQTLQQWNASQLSFFGRLKPTWNVCLQTSRGLQNMGTDLLSSNCLITFTESWYLGNVTPISNYHINITILLIFSKLVHRFS